MKILFFLLISVLMITAGDLLAVPNTNVQADTSQTGDCNCIDVRRIRGDNCGRKDSLRIEFRNVCTSPVNAQIFVKWDRQSGRQSVGSPSGLRPGTSSSYFWCQEPYEVVVACE